MKVKILSVHNHGNYEHEHVYMEVLQDCDIGEFMLADSTYTSDDRISNKVRHTYWFPDRQVKKGEYVSLWTGVGENIQTKSSQGNTIHRFYWGLKTSVWNDEGDCALLYHIDDWSHKKAK